MRLSLLLALAFAALGCGRDPVDTGDQTPPVPAVSTATPPPGPFNGTVEVTLATDKPATIFFTTDGSDPAAGGATVQSGAAPLKVTLKATTTLAWFSRTDEGADEAPQKGQYLRAGATPGTVTGVIVVGEFCVDQQLALMVDAQPMLFDAVSTPQEVPFTLTGLADGNHRLVAMSDRNGDGRFFPVLDVASQPFSFVLDLKDPFKASVEGVRLYLATSQPGLCTLKGTVTIPKPVNGQILNIAAVSPSSFGGGADPQALLAAMQAGYRVFTNDKQTEYPFVITDLEPDMYTPVGLLSGFGGGALGMNLIANPLKRVGCAADGTGTANLKYGPSQLSGSVTLNPATAPQGFVWGMVVARNASFLEGLQVELSPTFFAPTGTGNELKGSYAATALRDGVTFDLRAFTSLDPNDPITSALAWGINPFAPEKPHASVTTAATPVTADLVVP